MENSGDGTRPKTRQPVRTSATRFQRKLERKKAQLQQEQSAIKQTSSQQNLNSSADE